MDISTNNDAKLRFSIMIPTYNCAQFLEETLRSVLQQDLGEEYMQIVVVDDYSVNDNPEEVVNRIGNGRVQFYRQNKNVGAIKNFNTCIELASGEWIHILHGDDYVLPKFYSSIKSYILKFKEAGFFFTKSLIVNEIGNETGISEDLNFKNPITSLDRFLKHNPIKTPSVLVAKSVYNSIGVFDTNLVHTADWDMWIRAISATKGVYIDEPLCAYRNFGGNDTSRLFRSGEIVHDYYRFFNKQVLNGYMEQDEANKLKLEYLDIFYDMAKDMNDPEILDVYKKIINKLNNSEESIMQKSKIYLKNIFK